MSSSKITPGGIALVNALAAMLAVPATKGKGTSKVAQPTVEYAATTPPFDNSPKAIVARAERRAERLTVLAPVGMTNANHIMKPDVAGLLAVAEKIGKGKGTKGEKAALNAVVTRVRSGSLKFTAGAKEAAGVKPYAFVEQLEQLAQLA